MPKDDDDHNVNDNNHHDKKDESDNNYSYDVADEDNGKGEAVAKSIGNELIRMQHDFC